MENNAKIKKYELIIYYLVLIFQQKRQFVDVYSDYIEKVRDCLVDDKMLLLENDPYAIKNRWEFYKLFESKPLHVDWILSFIESNIEKFDSLTFSEPVVDSYEDNKISEFISDSNLISEVFVLLMDTIKFE